MFGFFKKVEAAAEPVGDVPNISSGKSWLYSGPRYNGPEFGRTYKSNLRDGNSVEIDAKYCSVYNRRTFSGMLRNAKGARVCFEVDNVAEKIIIGSVIKEVENVIRHVKKLDAEYLKSDECKSFTDTLGRKWKLI